MNFARHVLFAGALGMLVASAFLFLYKVAPFAIPSIFALILVLALWPSLILLFPFSELQYGSLELIAVALNGVTYGILGALVWLGRQVSGWVGGWTVIVLYFLFVMVTVAAI
jgi:hypothetical protein